MADDREPVQGGPHDRHGPDHAPPPMGPPPRRLRTAAERQADHELIEQLAQAVLPELIARASATDLAELEVREDAWRVRVRRPSGGWHAAADSRAERTGRAGTGGSHMPGLPYAVGEGRRASDHAASGSEGGNGSRPGLSPVGPGREIQPVGSGGPIGASGDLRRVAATSPAVGVFQPRGEVRAGFRVRAGDRIASVDLLGVPQDVVAPQDGVVVASLVEAGEGVEYGQQLILIEPVGMAHPAAAAMAAAEPGATGEMAVPEDEGN